MGYGLTWGPVRGLGGPVPDSGVRPLANRPPPWRIVVRRGRSTRLWDLVEAEHLALADRLSHLSADQWEAPSRCDGWRILDVLGHLVHLTEGYPESPPRAQTTGGHRPGHPGGTEVPAEKGGRSRLSVRLADRMHTGFYLRAKQIGESPAPELVERLRRAAAARYNGLPTVALSEALIHGDDMLQPLGLRCEVRPESALAALNLMRRVNRLAPGFAFQGSAHRGVRLVAEDLGWSGGHGPEARGAALDILALLANRAGAAEGLRGAGAEKLRQRTG